MKLFKQKKVEDWESIEAHEIDEIIAELGVLPSELSSLQDHLNEFITAVSILKKNKKRSLVENVHNRAVHLTTVLKELNQKFGKISEESERLDKIDEYIQSHFYILEVKVGSQLFIFHFNKKEGIIIGRTLLPSLTIYISREQILITSRNNKFEIESIGKNPLAISQKFLGNSLKQVNFESHEFSKSVIPINVEAFIYVSYQLDPFAAEYVFSFKILNFK